MGLSADLISKFVKATKDDKTTKDESTLYGTVKMVDGVTYVQLDGSEVLTPVLTTAYVQNGARVTVQIKNRVATITGNISDPSASGEDLHKLNQQIANWCDENDQTMINGAKIYTGTVSAKQIDVEDLFAQDITATGTITGVTIISESGRIGGWNITKEYLYNGVGLGVAGSSINKSCGMSAAGAYEAVHDTYAIFWANNAIFSVSKDGDIYGKDITASGKVKSKSEYISDRGDREWRFGSATGTSDEDEEWFGFDDSVSGYHGGIYGPDHSLRMYGEIQSEYPNAFRAVWGNYGFIIRTDGVNAYFLLTNSGDPYGSWRDMFPLNISLSDGTVKLGTEVQSSGIYNTTTSGTANLYISSQCYLKRSTSASKYKLDIQDIEQGDTLAYNVLKVSPRQWFDRSSIETYSEYLTAVANNTVDETKNYREDDVNLNPYYGLIAEDLVEAGLSRFCEYGLNDNGEQELEGIQYDRIPILFIPILRDLVACMQKILPSVKSYISDETTLNDISNIQERFALFNETEIITKEYDVDNMKGDTNNE